MEKTNSETISLVILGIIWVYSRKGEKGSHLPSLKNRCSRNV